MTTPSYYTNRIQQAGRVYYYWDYLRVAYDDIGEPGVLIDNVRRQLPRQPRFLVGDLPEVREVNVPGVCGRTANEQLRSETTREPHKSRRDLFTTAFMMFTR